MERCGLFTVVLFSFVWGSYSATRHSSFTVRIPPKRAECFSEIFEAKEPVRLEYQVIKGGNLDIDFSFAGLIPKNSAGTLMRRQKQQILEFDVDETGEYEICLDNKFSRLSEKWVFISFSIGRRIEGEDTVGNPPNQSAAIISKRMEEIGQKLEWVIFQLMSFKAREARHRYIADDNNSRVLWWSLLESAVMVFAGVIQVIVIRNLFRVKRQT